MTRRLPISVLTLFAFVSTAHAQVAAQLSPENITEALRAETPGCYLLAPAIGCFTTPYSRVVGKAQAQRRRYEELARTDITNDLIAPGELHVYAMAHDAAAGGVASVEAVVILPRGSDPKQVLRPSRTFEATAEFKNLMGASFQGKSIVAVFPLSALKGSNEVHIVFDRPVSAFKNAPPGYKTKAGDVLEVTVLGHNDLSAKRTVDSEGNIASPLLDRVGVAGLSDDEIRTRIEKLLKDYLVRPEVMVSITPVPCDDCSAQ